MSGRRASEDQVVPNKRARTVYTYDPELVVATMTVDPDLDIYPENALGKFEVLQTVESSGQGYYLLCNNMSLGGYFGPVLVKYLGGRNEITRQFRDYSGAGVSAGVATQIRLAEYEKNSKREIRFARELLNENIVRIVAFISPNGRPDSINAIIMEGDFDGTLEDYASRKQIPLPLVKAFALQLASALQYCHSLGIMHRDVRARNIYVQEGKRIKLGNFGYARVGDKDDIHTANKGEELYYRAPEMISIHTTTVYTVSVDVYGFALVLWSMLHGGKKPYKDDPACERLVRNETRFKQHLQEGNRPRIDDNLDQGLIKLIEECWINETEFNKRPSMSEVVQELQSISLDLVSRPLAKLAIKSNTESIRPVQLKKQKTIEFSPTLRRYTVENIGLTENQLKVSQQPYDVDGYIFGRIRLISVKEDYIPHIRVLFHKNIVAQYGLLETKNHGYFLMLEKTVGTSVQKHLEENKPTEEVTRSWLLDASRALNYCHSLNVPYGELSLDRLFVRERELKLEHPAVCRNSGQGVKQDLLELCKLALISSDDRMKSLSEKIESGTIKTASEVCRFLEELVPKATFEKGAKSLKRVAPCEEAVKAAKRRPLFELFRPDPSTEDQLNQTEEITSQGDSKRVYIHGLGYVTRTALRDDLLTNRFHEVDRHGYFTHTAVRNDLLEYQRLFKHIFELRHINLLTNYCFLRSDEADVNLHKFKAIISEEVMLAFDFFLLVDGILKLHLIPYQLIPRTRNSIYTADEVRAGRIPTKESDVYSAASVAYRILEGREPPLDKTGLYSTLVSAETNQLLTRSWAPPEDRPTAEALFRAILSEL